MSLIVRPQCADGDFDEEEADRDAVEIEQMLQEFRDEPPICHDQYPESEEEDAEKGSRKQHKSKPYSTRGDGRLFKDQVFFNGVAFKETVLDYALRTGRNLKQYRYDKEKIGFKCVGRGETACKWQIYCATLPKDNVWKVRLFVNTHICEPYGDCEMLKVPHIARLFVDKIREEPEYYMPKKIEEKIYEKWKFTVSRPQCQAARNTALRWIESEYDHQFARLKDYAAELTYSNKDSTVLIDTLTNANGQEEFNRFYVCYDVLRRTWKESMRPLIGVDGCFVKHKVKGQILVALGRDADNAIYPIAWGVVQVENTENWAWFVSNLKFDLDLKDGDGFILVSDRQKGLISAVKTELPKMEHRMCVKHIYGNLKAKFPGKKDMKPMIWNLAWSYNEAQYKARLDRIRCYDTGVYDYVIKSKPETWCRAFFKQGNYCEDVENNSTESFNSTINKAREKPFVPMLETITRLAMARIAKRSVTSHSHEGSCTPYVSKFLAKEHKKASECKVTRSTNGDFEARVSGCAFRVNLEKRTCTCLKFQICGIPCEHAYGVMLSKKLRPEDFVCHWFRTSTWKRNYVEGLVPVRGAPFWPQTSAPDIHVPTKPDEPNDPAKKKVTKADKTRKRSVNESPTKKQPKQKKRIMHCGICGVADHNSRFHKKKSTQASQGQEIEAEASQTNLSQVETGN